MISANQHRPFEAAANDCSPMILAQTRPDLNRVKKNSDDSFSAPCSAIRIKTQ